MKTKKSFFTIIMILSVMVLAQSCKDEAIEGPQVINFKGLRVNHTYDVPASIITNPNFEAIIEEKTNKILSERDLGNKILGIIVYSLEDLADIAEQEESLVPNDNWTDSQIMSRIYQDFPSIISIDEIEANWDIIGSYYNNIVQYNVTNRLGEVGTTIESLPFETSTDNAELDAFSLDPVDEQTFLFGLTQCEFNYLATRWAMANAARRAKNEARSESEARWPGSGSNDRQDVMRHLAGSWLIAHYYAKGLFQNKIHRIYDKCLAFLTFRENQSCGNAPDHVREMDRHNNLNGIAHWQNTAYTERRGLFNAKRVLAQDKGQALNFLSDVKTFWSVKVAESVPAVMAVDTWTCVYFVD